eukprot:g9187.t1
MVEGVGNMRQGLHPVQKRIAEMHGSQCGFCTPGIVMALYALLRSNPSATSVQIEEGLDGNLSRCTGFRRILDAAKSLGIDGGRPAGYCRGGGEGAGGGGCPCFDSKASTEAATSSSSSSSSTPSAVSSARSDQGGPDDSPLPTTNTPSGGEDQVLLETASIVAAAPKDGYTVPQAGTPPPPSSAPSGDGVGAEAEVGCGGDGGGYCKKQTKRECTASRAREPRRCCCGLEGSSDRSVAMLNGRMPDDDEGGGTEDCSSVPSNSKGSSI